MHDEDYADEAAWSRHEPDIATYYDRLMEGHCELLATRDVSALTGLSEYRVRQLARNHELPGSIKVGGRWNFVRGQLIAWFMKGGW